MASMVDRMIGQAEELVQENRSSAAARRRAVSTAYYAAFHELMHLCASTIAPDELPEYDLYRRVYRAIDHRQVKSVFKSGAASAMNAAIRRIGDLVVRLQSARMKADYSPPIRGLFTLGEVQEFLDEAREVVNELNDLSAGDRRRLAIMLLFKERQDD